MKNIKQDKILFTIILILTGFVLILLGFILSVSVGAKNIAFRDTISYLFNNTGDIEAGIIRDLRIPRAVTAILIGCFLAASGSLMQGITRNPIASPAIMGVTQGAAFAVSLYMIFQPLSGALGKVICSFAGASVSAMLVFLLSLKKSNINITRMILAGTALGMLFISLASMIALLTNHSRNLLFWIAGGLGGATWDSIKILGVTAIFTLTGALLISPKITILNLGDDVAIGLGEHPNRIRMISLLLIVLLSGSAAAIGGNIGFVCLIIPQIAKMSIGSDYRFILPVSIIMGGILLVYSDILARVIIAPAEIPLGSITSLLGVPFLIYLVRKESR